MAMWIHGLCEWASSSLPSLGLPGSLFQQIDWLSRTLGFEGCLCSVLSSMYLLRAEGKGCAVFLLFSSHTWLVTHPLLPPSPPSSAISVSACLQLYPVIPTSSENDLPSEAGRCVWVQTTSPRGDVQLLLAEHRLRHEHPDEWAVITTLPLTTWPRTNRFKASLCT